MGPAGRRPCWDPNPHLLASRPTWAQANPGCVAPGRATGMAHVRARKPMGRSTRSSLGSGAPGGGCMQLRPAWMRGDPDTLLPKTFPRAPLSRALHDVANNLFPPLSLPLPVPTEWLAIWHHPGSLRKHPSTPQEPHHRAPNHPPASSADYLQRVHLEVTSSSREPSRNHPPPPLPPRLPWHLSSYIGLARCTVIERPAGCPVPDLEALCLQKPLGKRETHPRADLGTK